MIITMVRTTKSPVYLNYSDDLDAIDSNGNVYAPEGPGIGVEIDWDWVRAHQVDRATWGVVPDPRPAYVAPPVASTPAVSDEASEVSTDIVEDEV